MVTTAGTMAMSRVMSRRSQGRSRMSRKPSITICPASVPVMVELWPAASRATANSDAGATVAPRSGVEQLVGVLDLGHVVACRACEERRPPASTRIAALIRRTPFRARSIESIVLKRIACARCPPASGRCAASAPAPSAGTGCGASPSRPGCRSRRTAPPVAGQSAGHQADAPSRATSGRARTDLDHEADADGERPARG